MFDIDKKVRYTVTVFIWQFVIVCVVTIISFSGDPAYVSREKSGFILQKIEPFVKKTIEKYDIDFINLDDLHFYIRKAAHIFIYFLLSALLCIGWKTVRIKRINSCYITWIIATVFSIFDEIYQLFIPGRSGEIRDVFLDNAGIILGLLFTAFGSFLFKKVRKKIS